MTGKRISFSLRLQQDKAWNSLELDIWLTTVCVNNDAWHCSLVRILKGFRGMNAWMPLTSCQASNCYTHFTNEWTTVKNQGDGIFVTGLGTAFQRSKSSHREGCGQSRCWNQHVELLFQLTGIEFIPSEVRLHKFIHTSLLAMQTCENRDSVSSVYSWAAFGH